MENIMLSRRTVPVNRGEANLLALVISLAVVAVMIIGVIKFGSNISDSNNVQAEYSNGTSLITNARARLKTDGIYDFNGTADMTGALIQFGGVPGGMKIVKRGELFKIDLQLIQDNQKRHNGELFKIKSAVV
ncbi:hypothetical protein L4B25_15605 [Salmonella enterica subsp. diarizonae serovar 16:z10:e,n,x,z15]|uniref:hypothetical protein n=1 Tax=Salmonella enterica TaxID=28901 RepID=UPI001F0F2044|nr:hypothetical protein [Salmonella enterica subsp. diarizonae serovar 16:z10:e,n,x,z15]MCH5503560.1 hypothetical protein [Salmonella enterica subsp. diarizonae serovar 16:z10:e,n,x,z15]